MGQEFRAHTEDHQDTSRATAKVLAFMTKNGKTTSFAKRGHQWNKDVHLSLDSSAWSSSTLSNHNIQNIQRQVTGFGIHICQTKIWDTQQGMNTSIGAPFLTEPYQHVFFQRMSSTVVLRPLPVFACNLVKGVWRASENNCEGLAPAESTRINGSTAEWKILSHKQILLCPWTFLHLGTNNFFSPQTVTVQQEKELKTSLIHTCCKMSSLKMIRKWQPQMLTNLHHVIVRVWQSNSMLQRRNTSNLALKQLGQCAIVRSEKTLRHRATTDQQQNGDEECLGHNSSWEMFFFQSFNSFCLQSLSLLAGQLKPALPPCGCMNTIVQWWYYHSDLVAPQWFHAMLPTYSRLWSLMTSNRKKH